jgi:hypothetical protein
VTTDYFGDGIIYVSGVGVDPVDRHSVPNEIIGNVFAATGPISTGGVGVPVLESVSGLFSPALCSPAVLTFPGCPHLKVYADGFGGGLTIERNAIIGVSGGGFTLCTWWDKSPVTSNAFFQLDGDGAIPTSNCDGNPVVTTNGNLHLVSGLY